MRPGAKPVLAITLALMAGCAVWLLLRGTPPAVAAPRLTTFPPGLVLIEGGATWIGMRLADAEAWVREDETALRFARTLSTQQPDYSTGVQQFGLMVSEVTNEQYAAFVDATGHRSPRHWPFTPSEALRPVVYVDHEDAQAYCFWAGLRLPTEEEFQRAVRGDTSRDYPWGEHWQDGACATSAIEGATGSFPVGSFPTGASEAGVHDLLGNVWEWTSSPFRAYPGWRMLEVKVVRGGKQERINGMVGWDPDDRIAVGGSFTNIPLAARCTTRRQTERLQRTSALGFRCAAGPGAGRDAAGLILARLRENTRDFAPLRAFDLLSSDPGRVLAIDRWSVRSAASDGDPPAGYEVIEGYEFLLFMPAERIDMELARVELGVFATDLALDEPRIPPGTYLVSLGDTELIFTDLGHGAEWRFPYGHGMGLASGAPGHGRVKQVSDRRFQLQFKSASGEAESRLHSFQIDVKLSPSTPVGEWRL